MMRAPVQAGERFVARRNNRSAASATGKAPSHRYPAGMSQHDIEALINRAIREHELRVALWSGLLGAVLMAGTWHAIWMCR